MYCTQFVVKNAIELISLRHYSGAIATAGLLVCSRKDTTVQGWGCGYGIFHNIPIDVMFCKDGVIIVNTNGADSMVLRSTFN